MLNKLKNLFKKPTTTEPAPKKEKAKKSEKDLATQRGEPYVSILKLDVDPNNINAGAFELDWNDKFLANLVRAGYQKKPDEPDHVIVDRWFSQVCRNIALEIYEQEVADPTKRGTEDLLHIRRKDIGNGRSEVS
jgi:hypothetical protein